jgi:hypothetical protein
LSAIEALSIPVTISGAFGLPVLRRWEARKIGEDGTETLKLIPWQWKVIAHVREKFPCWACEAIAQPPGSLASERTRACRSHKP